MQTLRRYWNRVRRGMVYFLLLIAFLLLQDIILCEIKPFGVSAFFVPALVVAVGLFEGGWRGGIFGLAAGVLMDLNGTSPRLLFTVFLPIAGFSVGFLTEFLFNARIFLFLAFAVLTDLFASFLQMFPLLSAHPESSAALWRTCILQTLWGVPLIFAAYFACRALPRRLR